MKYCYHCVKCNKTFLKPTDVCQHNLYYEYIEILYLYKNIRKLSLHKRRDALSKLLPIENKLLSLGEGGTPLIKIEKFSPLCKKHQVFVKNEAQNPTGSFKDRESSLIVSKARELGHKKVFIVSSGNAALSAAVYANKLNIECECFVPKNTSRAKKQMLRLYNANFHLIDGDYEAIYRKMVDNPPKNAWNITGGQNLFREEGGKKIAYEIWQQISVPDVILVPIGNGGLFSAVHKGFTELKKLGFTNKCPRLVGVQVRNAAPIKAALAQNRDFVALDRVPDSIAEGIIARESYCAPKVIRAIKETKGLIIEVTEREIIKALKDAIRLESLTPEPTSATVYAALRKLHFQNKRKLKIVCIQTGNGMKHLNEIVEVVNNS